MRTYKIILKNGASFQITAESFTVIVDRISEKAIGFDYQNVDPKGFHPLYIDPTDISAVLIEPSA